MYIYYFIILIIILLLCLRAYIRIKHGFWAVQPVVHSYDLFKLFYKSGIINKELPEINKYCDFINIKTWNYSDIFQSYRKKIHKFVCDNYLVNHDFSEYYPSFLFFDACFLGHNGNSFLSIYSDNCNYDKYNLKNLILKEKMDNSQDQKNQSKIFEDMDGVITGRPINLTIKNLTKIPVYYIDFLCVNKNKRKQGIAPKLIQTHEYNQRHLNKNVNVCLFKKEGELIGIVPLVIFKNNFYDISTELTSYSSQTFSQIKYVFINKTNFYLFINFLIQFYYLFDCVAIVEPSNILKLIEAEHIFIIVGILNEQIISSFIFKDFNITYKSGKIIELSCSLINPDYELNIIEFFSKSISVLNKQLFAKYLNIESISNNCLLVQSFEKINLYPKASTPSAYFLYNYCLNPILPEKCFILI